MPFGVEPECVDESKLLYKFTGSHVPSFCRHPCRVLIILPLAVALRPSFCRDQLLFTFLLWHANVLWDTSSMCICKRLLHCGGWKALSCEIAWCWKRLINGLASQGLAVPHLVCSGFDWPSNLYRKTARPNFRSCCAVQLFTVAIFDRMLLRLTWLLGTPLFGQILAVGIGKP